MNSEYEVRLLDIDKDKFIELLEKYNAKFIGDWIQKRYVYDFNPKIDNKWIRLRTNGLVSTLTIKNYTGNRIGDTKELEIEVSDFDKTDLILEELGYKKRSVQINKRVRYILDDVEIDIDTWPGLNTYVEFEGVDEECIKRLLNKIDIDYSDTTTMEVQDIYLSKGYTLEELNNLNFEEEIL